MSSKRSRAAFESADGGPPQHAPYAFYGTPLPAYDPDARDDGSYVPVWKQEVTDERGRKRLHGAFTGGFSAGYFNTVGSKEGFTPSTFVSSRSKRAKDQKDGAPRQQRVEDFMDDEDLAERAESQRLEIQDTFAGLGSGEGNNASRGMFADLFRATGETMGVKLLQRMGWRQGQGIGAKVRRNAKGDEKGEAHLFAPENSRMIKFTRKSDRKGLGYAGEERLSSFSATASGRADDNDDEGSDQDARILQTSRSRNLTKPKKIKKSGMGVGILNDTGSDDEDPYAMGPQINYNRIIGADRKKKKGLGQSNSALTITKTNNPAKKLGDRKTALSGFRKCHDGRLPLDGFILITTVPSFQENKYPPPQVPPGWTSTRSTKEGNQPSAPFTSTADAAKTSTLNPNSRAQLLGEQQLPGKSVFDFLSPAARERLAAASGKTNLPPALGEGAPAGYEASEADKRRTLWDLVPALDRQTAAAALQRGTSGWMPYAEDAEKRARYRYFLELSSGSQSNLPGRPKDFSVDEWVKELREFAQAAEVFKPISGLMATRFTTSTAAPRLATDAPDTAPAGAAAPAKEEDPAEKAAKLGMYGQMTRSRQPFYPTRLLCKRFGVKPPANVRVDPGAEPDDDGGVPATESGRDRLELVSQANMDRMMREASFKPSSGFVSGGTEGGEANPATTRQPHAQVDIETNDALESQKAGEEVFRAIFGSDDDDDDDA